MKYTVIGFVELPVSIDVEADTKEEAIRIAEDEWPGISSYAGNGAMSGKLVGTCEENVTISSCDDTPTFTDAFDEES